MSDLGRRQFTILVLWIVWQAIQATASIFGIIVDAEGALGQFSRVFLKMSYNPLFDLIVPAAFLLALIAVTLWPSRTSVHSAANSAAPVARRTEFTNGTKWADEGPIRPLTREQEEIERISKRYLDPLDRYMRSFMLSHRHHREPDFAMMTTIFASHPARVGLLHEAIVERRNDVRFWKNAFKDFFVMYNHEVKAADTLAKCLSTDVLKSIEHAHWKHHHQEALRILRDLSATPGLDGIHWAVGCVSEHHIENL